MSDVTAKHFDYLAEHAHELEAALGLLELVKKIDHWRCIGMEFPDDALVGSRKTMETALKSLLHIPSKKHTNLEEVIDSAEDEGLIDHRMALKCHEIRRIGNDGAHLASVKAIDASMSLELLDDFLRWCAEELRLIPAQSSDGVAPSDPIFIVKTDDEVAALSSKARLAAALDENKGIEKRARDAKSQLDAFSDSSSSDLQKMQELIKQAEEIGASAAAKQDEETLAAMRTLFDGLQSKVDVMNAERQAIASSFDAVETEVQEILNEHDFIKRLLGGGNQANVEQHNVMAFPRGSGSVTNILQVAGGAGTGKTLCLLAKLIAEVDEHGQQQLLGDYAKKNALFICFNRGLATYVRGILSGYSDAQPNIDVVHYDRFINQLVRHDPRDEFEYLKKYACDVRYPDTHKIVYGTDNEYIELLNEAQTAVAQRHPSRAGEYYLDSSNEEELEWLINELQWIEARFATKEDAFDAYPKASRVGRGTKHRPSEAMRRIILEVWDEFNRLLGTHELYTIEQATKRLMNTDSLPAYDAIAIDEVQDFSLMSIRLVLRFRRGDSSKVFLSGDENQKIYQRDFTWKELDEGLRGYTITLHKNMRNSPAIQRFCDRLLGFACSHEEASDKVHVVDADEERTIRLLRTLSNPELNETTALISGRSRWWSDTLRKAEVPVVKAEFGNISDAGIYLVGDRMGKGLEFDNVVVDYANEVGSDEEEEKRYRYVHFTRARKRLYIRYSGTPPKLLTEYYADFLE